MRFPQNPTELGRITRVARSLPMDQWDLFFSAVHEHFTRDGRHQYEPSPEDVALAIEAGLVAAAAGLAAIPLRFCERDALDGRRRAPPDPHITASWIATRSMRVRRAQGR